MKTIQDSIERRFTNGFTKVPAEKLSKDLHCLPDNKH